MNWSELRTIYLLYLKTTLVVHAYRLPLSTLGGCQFCNIDSCPEHCALTLPLVEDFKPPEPQCINTTELNHLHARLYIIEQPPETTPKTLSQGTNATLRRLLHVNARLTKAPKTKRSKQWCKWAQVMLYPSIGENYLEDRLICVCERATYYYSLLLDKSHYSLASTESPLRTTTRFDPTQAVTGYGYIDERRLDRFQSVYYEKKMQTKSAGLKLYCTLSMILTSISFIWRLYSEV